VKAKTTWLTDQIDHQRLLLLLHKAIAVLQKIKNNLNKNIKN
jgi:hypothetical protein